MKLIHAFVTSDRPEDLRFLRLHLSCWSRVASIIVICDRAPQAQAIAVECGAAADIMDFGGFRDSRLRQVAWDAAVGAGADVVAFADTDEFISQPERFRQYLQDAYADFDHNADYARWWNVFGSHIVAGQGSVWSHEHPGCNVKCLAMRARPCAKYPDNDRHSPMEPGRAAGGPFVPGPDARMIHGPFWHLRWAAGRTGGADYHVAAEASFVHARMDPITHPDVASVVADIGRGVWPTEWP